MKKSLLIFIIFLSTTASFGQTTVTLDQQTNYYYSNQSFNPPGAPGAFYNNNPSAISMITNANTNSYVVAWRKFNTARNNTGSNRALKIGDKFSITVNAYQAKGEIGVALLSSPSSTNSFADRTNNYAISVNLDGSDSLGSGNFGKWYVRGSNGDTSRATFGGTKSGSGSAHNYQIDFLLTANDRMNVTISDLTTITNKATFNDIHLNSINSITDYSIYLSNSDDGTFVAKNIYWTQNTSITNTASATLGKSNTSFLISQPLTDGSNPSTNASTKNNFIKDGLGNITLGSAATFTGFTKIINGTFTLGAVNALPTKVLGTIGNVKLNGGTLSSGTSSGFSLGTLANPAGILEVITNSSLSLGTGTHSLYFSNSADIWQDGQTLTINGWAGTAAGGGTSGKIFIGSDATGLSSTQLGLVTFTGFGTGAQLDPNTGELKPLYDPEPTLTASNLTFSNIQFTSHTVNFTPGNGTGGRIVIASAGAQPTNGPTNGTTYTASNTFGSGDGIGNGFVVFSSTGAASTTQSFTITGLSPGRTYYYSIYEYNGTGATTVYGPAYQGSQLSPDSYTTIADGNWENTSTWNCNCIPSANSPVSINNNVTLTQDESSSTVQIASGKTLADGGFTLTVSTSIVNNGTHSGTGRIKMLATNDLPISGTGIYQNVESAVTSGGNLNLTSDVTINGNLIISSDEVVIGSNTLRLNGAFSGSGTLTGSSSSNLTIGGASGPIPFTTTSAASKSLFNLSLISGTTSLNTALDLYGNVSFLGASSLDFAGQHVILRSTSTQNGTIGDLGTSFLLGATNVTVERYIPSERRAYRTIAPGVNTTSTIQANWQEGQMNTSPSTNVNNTPGYGTIIAGTGGNANGFDATQTNQYSLYTYNSTTNYLGVANTNINTLNAKTGYLFYIRGDRSVDVLSQANPLPTTSTILRATGTVATGDQTYSGIVDNPTGSASSGYTLISNPYPSLLSWSAVATDINNAGGGQVSLNYLYVDPNVGTQGGYVAYNTSGVYSPDPGHVVTNAIQPGQAFYIQAYTNGAPVGTPIVTIKESHKLSSGVNPTVFTALAPLQVFRASIFYNEANNNRRVIDGVATVFDDKYDIKVDKFDNPDLALFENLAINRSGVNLQIEARPTLAVDDTIKLYMSGMNARNYEMELEASNLVTPPGTLAFFVDNYLGTKTSVNLSGKTIIPFTVNSTAGTSASNRFYVVFGPASPLPVTLTSVSATKINTGAEIDWKVSQELNMDKYQVEKSLNGTDFNLLGSVISKGNSSNPVSYTYLDPAFAAGTSFYRIKMIDKTGVITYSQVVKLVAESSNALVSIFPNPVTGSILSMHFDNVAKGKYPVTISNNLGQVVYSNIINHLGGSSVESLNLQNAIPSGVYNVSIGVYNIKILKQ